MLESLIQAEHRERDTAQLQGAENTPEKLGHDTRDPYLPKKKNPQDPKEQRHPCSPT